MDNLNLEALDNLAAALKALLPPVADPSLAPLLSVNPTQVTPIGLGGYVGTQDSPAGEILGRRVQAMVVVTVRSVGADTINDAATAVTRAYLGADAATLRQSGIFGITLDSLGPVTANGGARRDVQFSVRYEYQKPPAAAEATISAIPLNVTIDSGPGA